MIEAKPVDVEYLLGREWELPQINKPLIKYPTSSSIYENRDGSASLIFGNYKNVNTEIESDSELETVNVISEDISLNKETVENLYKNSELINIMLEEFSNPTVLVEQTDKDNFIKIMCNQYTDEQIIDQLYNTRLVQKFMDIEVINQFTIKPKLEENQIEENLEINLDESVNTIEEENNQEFVNVKTEIMSYTNKYAILAKVDRTPEYLNKYILKIQGPVGLRLWSEFSTSEYINSPYIGARIEFVKSWLEKECVSIGEKSQIKKQDINRQLCRKLHIGENLAIVCREYKFRRLKKFFIKIKKKKKKKNVFQKIENLGN